MALVDAVTTATIALTGEKWSGDHFVLDVQFRLEPLVDRKFALPQPAASHRLLVQLDKTVKRADLEDVLKYLLDGIGIRVEE